MDRQITMAIRINRVYTRTGDDGDTALAGGKRVSKLSPAIEAFGSLDELNSFAGAAIALLREQPQPAAELRELIDQLLAIQQRLFDVGAYLATPPEKFKEGMPMVGPGDVEELEKTMDRWGAQLPPLASFILPGGGKPGAWLHLCRTVCRRVERRVLALHRERPIQAIVLAYLNRLSDYFFVASRHAARLCGVEETLWKPAGPR